MLYNKLFKEFLINNSNLDIDVLNEWEEKANNNLLPLHVELVKNAILSEEETYRHVASYIGIPYRYLQLTEVNLKLVKEFPRELLIEYQAIPLSFDGTNLVLLIANPFRFEELKELNFNHSYKISYELTIPSSMESIIDYINNKVEQRTVLDEYKISTTNTENPDLDAGIDAPVIKLCDAIIKEAVSRGASDIHIEPFSDSVVIRYRIDGELTKIDEAKIEMYPAILARFKIMSNINIAERRIPQDGKINMTINGSEYDLRVSTIPTIHSEKIVIRIFNLNFASSNLDSLGLTLNQKDLVLKLITRPYGIILLTGPTGSGKSTTLYTFLRYLNKENVNIITVEDPVENEIEGINQVQVNPKANLTFASSLRAILRQDPNVIMIGEIRDEETANIATRAAITGHLVFSTIHTNDASGVISRLINMGIPKYLVVDSLLASISQRLVRRLCPKCKKKDFVTVSEAKILGVDSDQEIYKSVGCPYCNNTGYLGRTAVYEFMVMDEKLKSIIMENEFSTEKLNDILKAAKTTLFDHMKQLVLDGVTSFYELEKLDDSISNN